MALTSDSEKGVALVSVLIVISILSIIATSLLFTESVSYRLSQNSISRDKADALTEAGVSRAILALLDQRPDRRWQADGDSYDFEFSGTRMKIRIEDEFGKIDINTANDELLKGVFRAAGLNAQAADTMLQRLLDWRDQDDLHRLNGAEASAYRAAGHSYKPRNGPLQTVDEIQMIMGMTPKLFARIEPALTVYSGRTDIDQRTAPREALRALSEMDEEKIEKIFTARFARKTLQAGKRGSKLNMNNALNPMSGGRAVTIRVELVTDNLEYVREATVRFTENSSQPYWILKWDHGSRLNTKSE